MIDERVKGGLLLGDVSNCSRQWGL